MFLFEESSSHLWQGGEALLLDLPDEFLSLELEALLDVELRHADPGLT